MMFGRPLLTQLKKKIKKNQPHSYSNLKDSEVDVTFEDESKLSFSSVHINRLESEHESFGELFIHQMIETIEFVLGSISNTASYLRLWALSLAHSQLAKVFFDMILKKSFSGEKGVFVGALMILPCFVFFFIVTFAVIMVMDYMECFLHALRLHWVEF